MKDVAEVTREQAQDQFLEMYDELSAEVAWLFLKRLRFMKLGYTKFNSSGILEDFLLPAKYLQGPEDIIVACRCLVLQHMDL